MTSSGFSRLIQKNFSKVIVASLAGTGLLGLLSFQVVDGRMQASQQHNANGSGDAENREISRDEALVRAMIENAKDSSWKENLNNAVQAHERFMLPGRPTEEPEFLDKVAKKSEKILEKQKQQQSEKENQTEKFSTWKR